MQQETILLIDDEPGVRESLSAFLSGEGYRIFTAGNGQAGLDIFYAEAIDLVITDLRMPLMDGIEVMTAVQAHDPDVPMVVISGAGKKNDVIKALQMGAKDYISKPVSDLDMLLHVISKALETRRLTLENKRYRQQLEKNEARYRTITQQIAEGVFTADDRENITFANPAFCRMTGFTRYELTGMNLEQITTRKSFDDILVQTQNRKKGMTNRYEIQMLHATGRPFHVELACSPRFDEKNRYAGSTVIARDITKIIALRKKYEEFLKQDPKKSTHNTVPICANCKSIRNKDKTWIPVEDFFSQVFFSHGICPDCCKKLYPDIDINDVD